VRPALSLAAFLVALVLALLVWGAPAQALSQRGHTFSFAFGGTGKGAGQFSEPVGVAVNDSTGNVYVTDHKNKRVEMFKPVRGTGGEVTGEEFVSEFAVARVGAIAVDNSTDAGDSSKGDVYVVGNNGKYVYKFTSEGAPLGEIHKFLSEGEKEILEPVEGIAVDAHGTLLVYQANHTILKFTDAVANEFEGEVQAAVNKPAPGFALDSEGNFYAGAQAAEGTSAREREAEEERLELFVVAKLDGTGKVLNAELDNEDSTAVAVNTADNSVYVDNVTTVAGKPRNTVAVFTPAGSLIQRLSAPGLTEGDAVAVNPADGSVYVADAASNKVYVFALEAPGPPAIEGTSTQSLAPQPPATNTTRLNATIDPNGADTHYHFEYGAGSCAATPSPCTQTASADIGEGFGDQLASLEVQSLPPGSYRYRVVAENKFGTVTSAERTFTILALMSGLPDGREWEMVSPAEKDGAEPEAITKEGGVIQASEDGHAISFVADGPMPAKDEPEGNRSPELTQIMSFRGSQGWLAKDVATANTQGTGIASGAPPEFHYFSPSLSLALVEPSHGANHSGTLERPPLSPPITPGEPQERTMYLRDNAPLQPEASEAANFQAAAHNGSLMQPANPGFLALVTQANSPGLPGPAEFGGGEREGLEFLGATPNLAHVVFASFKATPGLYEWSGTGKPLLVSVLPGGERVDPTIAELGGDANRDVRRAISNDGTRVVWTDLTHLYVRDTATQETLQLDTRQEGVLERGAPKAVFQTASADGSKVFFTDTQRLTTDSRAGSNEEPDLYVYELSGGNSPGNPLTGTLTDLTPEGPNGGSGNVLVYEHSLGGGVIGASEDGSYVYFVANGALSPSAVRGDCASVEEVQPRGTTCNLYVRHFEGGKWGPTRLIAALSSEDRSDWGGISTQIGDLAYMSARVSPNGRYLAFMSNRSLTGYNNEDVSSKAPGERIDEEVYLYDANSERLTCASCNPTGARPVGVFDVGSNDAGGAGEGLGLVVDRPQIWGQEKRAVDSWLAASLPGWTAVERIRALYQSRYLLDSGRLFFNSADALVPLAHATKTENVKGEEQQVGVENVYEFDPSGLGACHSEGGCVGLISSGTSEHESAFLDASMSGNDVFFLTSAKLASQDVDSNFDVYDAHICEASSPCPPPPPAPVPPCEGEACQGAYSSASSSPAAATATFSGPGNVLGQVQVLGSKEAAKPTPKPLTRAQKLAKALKACRKDKQKSKRVSCEKQARKKYGPVKSTAKKSVAGGRG
jgi:DNA-binding beta-propeller fold protein YncE